MSFAGMEAHERGEVTYYYTGNDRSLELLMNIDIDCKGGVGSVAGAKAFATVIEQKLGITIYWEPSTSGTGLHGYFWLNTRGLSAHQSNARFDYLQTYLRALAATTNADISGIDVQGTCPTYVLTWVDRKPQIVNFANGRLGKLPRTATARTGEFMAIAKIDPAVIDRLVVPKVKTLAPAQKNKLKSGSYGGIIELPEDIGQQVINLIPLARRQLGGLGRTLQAKYRYVVDEVDLAIGLWVGTYCTHFKANKDGSAPEKYLSAVWHAVTDAVVHLNDGHRWSGDKWRAMRGLINRQQNIEWQGDHGHVYTPPSVDGHGEIVKGQACRWRWGSRLQAEIQAVLTWGGNWTIQDGASSSGEPVIGAETPRKPISRWMVDRQILRLPPIW